MITMSIHLKIAVVVGLTFFRLTCVAANEFARQVPLGAGEVDPNYYSLIIEAFSGILGDGARASVAVIPAAQPEYALAIRGDSTTTVVKQTSKMRLWPYIRLDHLKSGSEKVVDKYGRLVMDEEGIKAIELAYPKDFHDVGVDVCEARVPTHLAERVVAVWSHMLLSANTISSNPPSFDATSYHFFGVRGDERLYGTVWGPTVDSKTDLLVELVRQLSEYCDGNSAIGLVEEAVKNLEEMKASLH